MLLLVLILWPSLPFLFVVPLQCIWLLFIVLFLVIALVVIHLLVVALIFFIIVLLPVVHLVILLASSTEVLLLFLSVLVVFVEVQSAQQELQVCLVLNINNGLVIMFALPVLAVCP